MDAHEFLQWEAASQEFIKVKTVYIDITNDLVAGVLLSKIISWNLPKKDGSSRLTVHRDGRLWLAKKREDWWDECRITPKQYDRASEILETLGLIVLERFHFNGLNMVHVSLNLQEVVNRAMESIQRGSSKFPKGQVGTSPKVKFLLKKENTAKITPSYKVPADGNSLVMENAGDYADSLFSQEALGSEGEVAKGRAALIEENLVPTLATSSSHEGSPKKKGASSLDAEEVLAYLNRISESRFKKPGLIPARLKEGITVEDCKLVIDWVAATWSDKVREQYFNHTTPFRPGNFDKNLASAMKWRLREEARLVKPSPTPPALAPTAGGDATDVFQASNAEDLGFFVQPRRSDYAS